MHKLTTDINTVIRQFGAANGNFVESLARALPFLSVLLTAIITIGTIITGGDENTGPGTEQPPVVTPVENAQMRTDLELAINYQRSQQGLQPAEFDMSLRSSAQQKAMENAAGGSLATQAQSESQIIRLQARQDTATATADSFIHLWAQDDANYNALMSPENDAIGVGVAEAGGKTYAVVQFTQN